MKGKKVDNHFVSNFISDCCSTGKLTTDEIVASAKSQIDEIDRKIIEVENLKKQRSKLLDVVIVFDRNHRSGSQIDEVLIKFHRVKDKKIAQRICAEIFRYSSVVEIKEAFPRVEEIFCMKQLLEFEVLQRNEDTIIAGKNYPAFKNFLKENYEVNR